MYVEDYEQVAGVLENLDHFEEVLLNYERKLKRGEDDISLIHLMFRHVHNTKGALAMLELVTLVSLLHEMETSLDLIRNHQINGSQELVDLCFESVTHVRNALEGSEEDLEDMDRVKEAINHHCQTSLNSGTQQKHSGIKLTEEEKVKYQISKQAGHHFFQLEKMLSNGLSEEEFRDLNIFNDIKEVGILIALRPHSWEDYRKEKNSEVIIQIIFSSEMKQDDLELYIFDPFREVVFE